MPNRPVSAPPANADRAFDLQGHRGARGLWPENTLPGIAAALALGVTSIEIDVVLAADAVPVVFHDLRLQRDRVRDTAGRWVAAPGTPLSAITSAALAGYDVGRLRPGSRSAALCPHQCPADGARIPHLAEVCAALRGTGVRLDIEIKASDAPERAIEAVLAVVQEMTEAGQVSVRSFDWRLLRLARRLRSDLPVAWLTGALPRVRPAEVAAEVRRTGWPLWRPCWAPDHRTLLKRDVLQAHAAGLAVVPYTVNREFRMVQMLDWGVNGFCTDRPDIAREVLRAAGAALPVAAVERGQSVTRSASSRV
jgi:glycerophosphoryl diester phosphodiesterase